MFGVYEERKTSNESLSLANRFNISKFPLIMFYYKDSNETY